MQFIRFCGPDNKEPKNIKFDKLKHLKLYGKVGYLDFDLPYPEEWLKRVNPDVFETLKLNYSDYDYDNQMRTVFKNLTEASTRLNLKKFKLLLYKIKQSHLESLTCFLKTQKNLTTLQLGFDITAPLNTLEVIIKELPKLTSLSYCDFDTFDIDESARQRIIALLHKHNENPDIFELNGVDVLSVFCDCESSIEDSDSDEGSSETEQSSAEKAD